MKKFLAFALALIMVFTLAACGGGDDKNSSGSTSNPGSNTSKPGNSGTESKDTSNPVINAPGKDYATSYEFYADLTNKLATTITDIVEENNKRLEEEKPDSYISDPSYILIFLYIPFLSIDMAFTAAVTDDIDPAGLALAYSFFGIDDAKLTIQSPGRYKITYTLPDRDDDTKTNSIEELLRYENGSIRYEQRINGELDEFYEFISLGGDRYALQGKRDRAIIKYKNGEIIEVIHSETMYEKDSKTGELKEWSVLYDPDSDSIWGKSNLDEDWVRELESSGGLKRIYELKDGKLTISGQNSNYDWQTGETTIEPMTPIVISVD